MKKLFVFAIVALVVALFSASAMAATILSSNPYPAGSGKPSAFVVIEGTITAGVFTATKTYPESPAKINTDGTAVLWFDTSAMADGLKAVIVKAKNAAGESTATPPFSFTLPVPTIPLTPSGLFLVNQ